MDFAQVEKARKTYDEKFKKGIFISLAVAVIGTAIMIAIAGLKSTASLAEILITIFFFLFVLTIGYTITSFATTKEASSYRSAYKKYFVEQNLRQCFTDLNYHHDAGLTKETLAPIGMLNLGDQFSSNDYASGRYKEVSFAQSDVSIRERHTDSEGHTYYVTIFKGRVMLFEFPKKFNFKLELIGRKFHAYHVPRGTNRRLEEIDTESSDFNRAFKIYAEDGFEAFYILDPAMILKIHAIADRYKYNVLFGFADNRLLIALNDGKDSFEPPHRSAKIDEKEELSRVSNEIKVITELVDKLSLNRKLFKK